MHEITERHALLDEQGRLTEPGYARSLILNYDRSAIKAPRHRIKEWDYYLVTAPGLAVALTIDDNSYMGLDSVSLLILDPGKPWEITTSLMQFMTGGRKNLPPTSDSGDVHTKGKTHEISFLRVGDKRILEFRMDKFRNGKPIRGEFTLLDPVDDPDDSMVIATPFPGNEKAFYYNQKKIAMPASGWVEYDGTRYEFKEGESFGLLDWGRGVWTYKNTWYWGAAQGKLPDGRRFGWNIGYGFGDTSAASENMVFVNGVAHKLGRLVFDIPDKNGTYTTRGGCCMPSGKTVETAERVDDFMSPWVITSDDGRFEMVFRPLLDRAAKTDFKVLCSDQHQVFGLFTGVVILDDGSTVYVEDFPGFAEKVFNKW
jgi:hypothetical protein